MKYQYRQELTYCFIYARLVLTKNLQNLCRKLVQFKPKKSSKYQLYVKKKKKN